VRCNTLTRVDDLGSLCACRIAQTLNINHLGRDPLEFGKVRDGRALVTREVCKRIWWQFVIQVHRSSSSCLMTLQLDSLTTSPLHAGLLSSTVVRLSSSLHLLDSLPVGIVIRKLTRPPASSYLLDMLLSNRSCCSYRLSFCRYGPSRADDLRSRPTAIAIRQFNTPVPLLVSEEALLDPSTLVADKEIPSLATHTVYLSQRESLGLPLEPRSRLIIGLRTITCQSPFS
jgi:hypothetical protein